MFMQNGTTTDPSPRCGTIGNLTASEEQRYAELEGILAVEPELFVKAHARENRTRRLLRHLRANDFDVHLALKSIHDQVVAWNEIGMDHFSDKDELQESDAMFVCGEDLWGRTTVICRPGVFLAKDEQDSVNTARRCIWTFQRAIEQLRPGLDQVMVLYDLYGVTRRHFDLVFIREIVFFMGVLFPDRMASCICVNVHWSMLVFWRAMQPMLPLKTQAKVQINGADVVKALGNVFSSDHPYLQYLLKVQGLSAADRQAVPVPRATVFEPRWREALEADNLATSEVCCKTPVATGKVNMFLSYFACCCGNDRRAVEAVSALSFQAEEREPVRPVLTDRPVISSHDLKVNDPLARWPRSFSLCRCSKRNPRAKYALTKPCSLATRASVPS